jgi:polyphosphate kinase
MRRNLDNRVEISCPIYDEIIKEEILDTFAICWSDNVKARIISEIQDNAYRKNNKPKTRSQFALYEYYKNKLEN